MDELGSECPALNGDALAAHPLLLDLMRSMASPSSELRSRGVLELGDECGSGEYLPEPSERLPFERRLS